MSCYIPQSIRNYPLAPPPPARVGIGYASPQRFGYFLGTSTIGWPITIDFGQHAGRAIRAELEELQKADLGRKYSRKDRRPLDPPPVVQLRLFEVHNVGTPAQTEEEFSDYDSMKSLGIICHVDLFPIPDGDDMSMDVPSDIDSTPYGDAETGPSKVEPYVELFPSPISNSPAPSGSTTYESIYRQSPSPPTYAVPSLLPSSLSNHSYSIPAPLSLPLGYHRSELYPSALLPSLAPPEYFSIPSQVPLPLSIPPTSLGTEMLPIFTPMSYQESSSADPYLLGSSISPFPSPLSSFSTAQSSGSFSPAPPAQICSEDPDIVAYYNDFPIRESTKCTEALSGATFVQSSGLEYQGRKALMFIFSDLAVKMEGTFLLRYRVFNIYSTVQPDDIPVLAECYGGPFKVYSTKEFPGLPPSTDFTKHISDHGVRLNTREHERKRRKKSEIEADEAAAAAAAISRTVAMTPETTPEMTPEATNSVVSDEQMTREIAVDSSPSVPPSVLQSPATSIYSVSTNPDDTLPCDR